MNQEQKTEAEAAAFRHLLKHLDANKDVQNIDLMVLADFCRNCLAKWYMAAANEQGAEMDYNQAREEIYGMPFSEWKEKYQLPASAEQLAAFEARQEAKKLATEPSTSGCQ
ncbi:DUF1244 domain-containing protein [Paraglaciecola sp.]|uniref:DUF1244 domain-containing protein n=1 Tax=Paraglaciecola sp. TaxID=1920173 RepID=UPI003264AB2B